MTLYMSTPSLLSLFLLQLCYSLDEYMNIDLNVTDDSSVDLCYTIDDDQYPTCINSYKTIKQVNLPVTFQLQLNMYKKSFTDHQLNIYLKDIHGAISSTMTKQFTYMKSHAPNITLDPHTFKGKYAFSDSFTFSGRSFEIDEGDRVGIFARVDSQELVELGHYVAKNQYHPFKYSVKIPPANGIHKLFVVAYDQHGIKSKTEELEFAVQLQPSIRLNKPLKKSYMRDETVFIDMKLIDFNPGATLKLFYALDRENKTFIRDVLIGENLTSDDFIIEIPPPGDRISHYLSLWVEAEDVILSNEWEKFIVYNDAPIIELNNEILDRYYKPAYIDLDLNVWDDKNCTIFYRINEDGNELEVANSYVDCYRRKLNKKCQIRFDRPGTETFELWIYAKDKEDAISNIIRKTITFDASSSTPKLVAKFINPYFVEKSYRFSDTIPVHITISDKSVNSKVDIMYRYNDTEPKVYKTVVLDGSDIELDCQIPTIDKNGDYFLFIQLVRQDGVKSGSEFHFVGIYKYPSFVFAEDANNGYIFDEDVTFNVQLRDFEPNRYVIFNISHPLAKQNSVKTVKMNADYRSDNFTIMFPKLPIGRHLVLFKVGYSEKSSIIEIYHEVSIKERPKLTLHNQPKSTYYMNDHMDLYYSLIDSAARTKIYYEFSPILRFRLEEINTFGENYTIHKQIDVNQATLVEGTYQFKFWAEDEFGYTSNITEFEITVSRENTAPDIQLSSITQDLDEPLSRVVYWYEKIRVVGQMKDENVGDIVKIIWRVDYNTYGEVGSITANGEWQDFNVSFHVPYLLNKIVDFAFELVDSKGAVSRFIHAKFRIRKTPSVIIKTMKPVYKPGEQVTVRGYVVDLDPGTEVNVYYKFDTNSARRLNAAANSLGKFTINDEYFTPEFSFDIVIPEASNYNGLHIWAENNGEKVASFEDSYGIINFKPELRVITEIEQNYYNKGAFSFDAKVKDNTKVKIICIVDALPRVELTDWIECNNSEIIVHDVELEINSSYIDFGQHRIQIFAQDSAGSTSNIESFDFTLIDKNAPILEILETDINTTYSSIDIVTIQCRFYDENINDTVKLYYNINHMGEILIYQGIATGDWVYFNYTIPVPKSDGVYLATMRVGNEKNGARSLTKDFEFKIEDNPITWSKPYMPVFRYTDPTNHGGIVYESDKPFKELLPNNIAYPPQGYAFFSYEDTNFAIDIRTIHDSITLQAIIDKYLPHRKLNGTLNIYISDENNKTIRTIHQPIITNDPPTFSLINEINDKLYGNAYINLDIKLTDDGSAKMLYRIDDDKEKDLTEFYSLFGKSKSIKKQIEIAFGEISYSKHILTLIAVDELGKRSEEQSYPFYYSNSFSPTLDIEPLSKSDYNAKESVLVSGYIDDGDGEDNITVYLRTDTEFVPIYFCPADRRPDCHQFTYIITDHKNKGSNSVLFQARDDHGASSKDSSVEYNIVDEIENKPSGKTPYRTPVPHPHPTYLPKDFTGRTTYIKYSTYSMTYRTDNEGSTYTTYIEIETTQAIEIISPTEKVELGFFDTVFGKYILWPILVVVIGILIGAIILFIYLKKKQDDDEEESTAEMEVETVQNVTVDDTSITRDNPLFSTTAQADDPFRQDFCENDQIAPEDTTIVDENEDITTSSSS